MRETESESEFRLPEERLREHHDKLLEAIANESAMFNNKQLSDIIGRSESTTSKHLNNLCRAGYIDKGSDGYNNYYELRDRGRNYLRSMGDEFELDCRGHDIVYKFPILRSPNEDIDTNVFTVNKNISNWSKQLTRKEDSNVVAQINGESSVTILVKEVFASTAEDAVLFGYNIAERALHDLVQDLSNLVVGKDISGRVYTCSISRQSQAITNETFAEMCSQFNIHYSGADTGGRLEVDQSHNTPEIEFTDPDYAQQDFDRYKKFIESILRGSITRGSLQFIEENKEKFEKLATLDIDSLEEEYGSNKNNVD